jgi:sugar/nucleoside kinase (ribokinase family)
MSRRIKISGTGCCLVDQIYPDVDFGREPIAGYLSTQEGDGGLYPGRLVFREQFESFAGTDLQSLLHRIEKEKGKPVFNVGGPSIVALIHAAQLLQGSPAQVRFYGARGRDPAGDFLQSKLEQTPVRTGNFMLMDGDTPSTVVLSDPSYHDGEGERMFINTIGTAWNMSMEHLGEGFFDADIVVFGGTALVPDLHDNLAGLVGKARERGCITVVNTVYDFRSEMERPGMQWKLGSSDETYRNTGLLIMDREEACRLSGYDDPEKTAGYFADRGVSSFIITNGTRDTVCYSDGRVFGALPLSHFPVSANLLRDLKQSRVGDTTGCGDNFTGGVLASMAWQLQEGRTSPDLEECVAWGTVSGGYCCFHVGGTFIERMPGEKVKQLRPYHQHYIRQIHG